MKNGKQKTNYTSKQVMEDSAQKVKTGDTFWKNHPSAPQDEFSKTKNNSLEYMTSEKSVVNEKVTSLDSEQNTLTVYRSSL